MAEYKWIEELPRPVPMNVIPTSGMRVFANDRGYIICQCRIGENLWGLIHPSFCGNEFWGVEFEYLVGWLNEHSAKLESRPEESL